MDEHALAGGGRTPVGQQGRSSRGRRVRALMAGAALMAGVGLAGVAGPAAAAAPLGAAATDVPAVIQPPAGAVKVATYRVLLGAQVYKCTAGAWGFKEPAALLVREDARGAIHHFAGPSWKSLRDGSLVTAAKQAESSVTGAIPQLLLKVNSHSGNPKGELAEVDFIQRLNTKGGLTPTGKCTDGEERAVPYGADYVFFEIR
jgi:hypothetical protein